MNTLAEMQLLGVVRFLGEGFGYGAMHQAINGLQYSHHIHPHELPFALYANGLRAQIDYERMREIISHEWYRTDPVGAIVRYEGTDSCYGTLPEPERAKAEAKAKNDPLFKIEAGFVPFLLNGSVGVIIISVDRCPICNQVMVDIPQKAGVFRYTQDQFAKAGWQRKSTVYLQQHDEYACQDCVEQGRITFTCYLCNEQRPTSEVQESFGLPADLLCTTCYTTVSAKTWTDCVVHLQHAHQWDFS